MRRSLMGLRDEMDAAQRTHWQLNEVWQTFQAAVLRFPPSGWKMPSEYSVEKQSEDELRFRYLGVNWYARFLHDLRYGTIEYGTLMATPVQGQNKRVQVKVIQFDRNGNVEGEEDGLIPDAQGFHIDFLATEAPAFITHGGYLASALACRLEREAASHPME